MTALKGIIIAFLIAAASVAAQQPPQQPPAFKSSADVIAVDVQVVTRDGMPITGLTAEQFEVFIDGRRRPKSGTGRPSLCQREVRQARGHL